VQAFAPLLEQQPNAHGTLGIALDEQLTPPTLVVLSGGGDAPAWLRAINAQYLPHVLALAIPPEVQGLPAALAKPAGGGLQAWVCQGVTCLPPITDLAAVLIAITEREA